MALTLERYATTMTLEDCRTVLYDELKDRGENPEIYEKMSAACMLSDCRIIDDKRYAGSVSSDSDVRTDTEEEDTEEEEEYYGGQWALHELEVYDPETKTLIYRDDETSLEDYILWNEHNVQCDRCSSTRLSGCRYCGVCGRSRKRMRDHYIKPSKKTTVLCCDDCECMFTSRYMRHCTHYSY
jgi:hypothetical protein